MESSCLKWRGEGVANMPCPCETSMAPSSTVKTLIFTLTSLRHFPLRIFERKAW